MATTRAARSRSVAVSGENRERAEAIVTAIEQLAAKFARLDVVPLDVLDNLERVVVELHTANLLRLPYYFTDNEDVPPKRGRAA